MRKDMKERQHQNIFDNDRVSLARAMKLMLYRLSCGAPVLAPLFLRVLHSGSHYDSLDPLTTQI